MTSNRTTRTAPIATLAAALVVVGGCGRPAHQLETAPVTGWVILDGEPVTSGYIYTAPRKGRLATGKIASDGFFRLGTYKKADGATLGEHAVMLAPIPADEGPTPAGAVVPPARYASASSSGLTIDVPAEGLTDYHIDLESSPNDLRATPTGPQLIE